MAMRNREDDGMITKVCLLYTSRLLPAEAAARQESSLALSVCSLRSHPPLPRGEALVKRDVYKRQSILWFLVPGYVFAIAISFVVPKLITAIAFDAGGVASCPMTATFLLPLAQGACVAVGGNTVPDACLLYTSRSPPAAPSGYRCCPRRGTRCPE